jgi:cobalt-zinc-cadmium efflux system outer membrane protein
VARPRSVGFLPDPSNRRFRRDHVFDHAWNPRAPGPHRGGAGALAAGPGRAAAEPPLTLERAWQLAEQANPALRAAQANLAAAEGQLDDARALLWNNPQLAAERARRRVPQPGLGDDTQREWRAELSQALEIAGQRGHRREAAEQDLAALKELIEETRRQVRAEVEQKFVRVLGLQQRAAMEAELVALIRDNTGIARKRFEAGEDTRLDSNLAEVELGRSANQLDGVREQLIQARAELAAAAATAGADPAGGAGRADGRRRLPLHPGAVAGGGGRAAPAARARPPRTGRPQPARPGARRRLAGRHRGLFSGREGPGDARERISRHLRLAAPAAVSPQRGRHRQGDGGTRPGADRAAGRRPRHARDAVLALWQKLGSLRERARSGWSESVLQRLQENQRLSAAAYRAGEIGLTQLLLATRQVLDTRREVLEAATDFALTRIELEQAAGWRGGQ